MTKTVVDFITAPLYSMHTSVMPVPAPSVNRAMNVAVKIFCANTRSRCTTDIGESSYDVTGLCGLICLSVCDLCVCLSVCDSAVLTHAALLA